MSALKDRILDIIILFGARTLDRLTLRAGGRLACADLTGTRFSSTQAVGGEPKTRGPVSTPAVGQAALLIGPTSFTEHGLTRAPSLV